MSDKVYKYLLSKKHVDYIEVELHCSEHCNLACGFCCQDHNDTIVTKQRLVEKLSILQTFIEKQTLNKYIVNIMGGELFTDTTPNEIFDLYLWFLNSISVLLKGKDLTFGITTNLVFENTQRFETFYKKVKSKYKTELHVSYDTKGRSWNKQQLETYKQNIETFSKYISNISIVLHKLTILELLKKGDSYMDYLYSKFKLDFSWYVPKSKTTAAAIFAPSDQDCLNILKYLKEHYPKSSPIQQYINEPQNPIQCCSENRILIDAYNKTSNCIYLADDYKQQDFKTTFDKHTTSKLFNTFVTEKKCHTCPHFNKCGMYCFVLNDYKQRIETMECFMREFFDSLKSI